MGEDGAQVSGESGVRTVIVTDRGKPVIVLRTYDARAATKQAPVDYLKRLRRRMPTSISAADRSALDEANRGER